MKTKKLHFVLQGVGKYIDDILVVIGLGFLAAAGFEIHLVVGLAVLGVGCIGYGIFVSLGR
jgi:hypothetical protein